MPVAKQMKHSGGWLIALGAISILAGMLAIALPLAAGLAVATIVGIVLLVVGVIQIVGAFKAGAFGAGLADFLGGVLYALVGALALLKPIPALAAIALLIAIFFLVRGIYQVWAAFQIKPAQGWGWLLFGGILALLLGVLLLAKWPSSKLWVVGLFVGIELIFTGWTDIFLGMGLRRVGDRLQEKGEAFRERVDQAGRKLGEGADEPDTAS